MKAPKWSKGAIKADKNETNLGHDDDNDENEMKMLKLILPKKNSHILFDNNSLE
jgi:hypothetical protein